MQKIERSIIRNSMPFDWSLNSDSPEFVNLVKSITNEHVVPAYERAPRTLRPVWECTGLVLANLFTATFQHPQRSVFYTRDKALIGKWGFSAEIFLRRVIGSLAKNGLIQCYDGEKGVGFWDPELKRPLRSRMLATRRLIKEFGNHQITSFMIQQTRDFPLIRMKNADKEVMPLPSDRISSRRIKEMSQRMMEINEFLQQCFVGLHVTDRQLDGINFQLASDPDKVVINNTRKRLYRVFNNCSLEEGGRLTGGWWQEVPSRFRPHIYVAGPWDYEPKPVAEVDFSSMFPAIAYGLLGKTLPEGAYGLCGKNQTPAIRKVVKRCLLTMLMASSATSTRKAVHVELSKEYLRRNTSQYQTSVSAKGNGRRIRLVPEDCVLPKGCPKLADIIGQLAIDHEPLRAEGFFFNPESGRHLMFKESEIAERIVHEFMLGNRTPVLPIHDSFLVMSSWAGIDSDSPGYLDTHMRRVFKDVIGVDCRLTFDERDWQLEANRKIRRRAKRAQVMKSRHQRSLAEMDPSSVDAQSLREQIKKCDKEIDSKSLCEIVTTEDTFKWMDKEQTLYRRYNRQVQDFRTHQDSLKEKYRVDHPPGADETISKELEF